MVASGVACWSMFRSVRFGSVGACFGKPRQGDLLQANRLWQIFGSKHVESGRDASERV